MATQCDAARQRHESWLSTQPLSVRFDRDPHAQQQRVGRDDAESLARPGRDAPDELHGALLRFSSDGSPQLSAPSESLGERNTKKTQFQY